MIYVGFALAALLFASTIYFYLKAEKATGKLHEVEKKLARESSSEEITDRFKVLSEEVLDKQDAKANKAIDTMLKPMREQVSGFQGRVEEFVKENRQTQTILDEKFKNLDVNINQLGEEAQQLTTVLRGNSKSRGDWGEMVLEKALELAGLRENYNYKRQKTYHLEGKQVRPDVVILLPEGREFIIDAKVPMIAYDEYVNTDDEKIRTDAHQRFGEDVKKMVLEVAKYHSIPNTPGFAMMFIPIEPAWVLLSRNNPKLIEDSYAKGVLIVGPTNMLAALKMIEQMWRNENRFQSITKITGRAEKLMEAVELLVDRVAKSRKYLNRAAEEIDSIDTSIHGKSGVVLHANKLKEYGVKGKGTLPASRENNLPETESEQHQNTKKHETIAD